MDYIQISIEEMIHQKRIWIYGIGVIGKRVCQIFKYFKINIEGIFVSSLRENIDCFMGIPVREFPSLEFRNDDLIIVTVTSKAQEEIIKNISLNNVNYIIWTPHLLRSLWKGCRYTFENRIKGKKKLCFVLSGYKNYLWNNVFKRLKENAPDDVEICLCSAGKYVDELSVIAQKNNWSYLYTDINSVSLIQNICISLYKDAEWIFKMDEDMFITSGIFKNLIKTANEIKNSDIYEFGLCSPLIPVNAIGYRFVLEKYKSLQIFENKFGKALLGGCPQREIEKNPEAAKFMWSHEGIPQLDQMAKDMQNEKEYQICNTRLSIGFILFHRELWEKMQGFIVYGNMDLGVDEEDINAYCINNSKIMAISMNSVAGHFGFGKQTNEMKKFYIENPEQF